MAGSDTPMISPNSNGGGGVLPCKINKRAGSGVTLVYVINVFLQNQEVTRGDLHLLQQMPFNHM